MIFIIQINQYVFIRSQINMTINLGVFTSMYLKFRATVSIAPTYLLNTRDGNYVHCYEFKKLTLHIFDFVRVLPAHGIDQINKYCIRKLRRK